MPQVSIIVPIYKAESSLERCIKSILNQSYRDFELILIDDGSPDNCGTICDNYVGMDARIRVVHKKNEGVSSARNEGIKLAQGKYFCFIDSDDDVDAQFLLSLVSLYDKNIDLAICGYNWVKDNSVVRTTKFSDNDCDCLDRTEVFQLHGKIMISAPWCKLFRADIIRKNALYFDETISLGEDLIFNFSYLNYANDIAVVNKCLYNYRIDNENSLLRKYRRDLFDNTIKMNSALYNIIANWELSEESYRMFYDSVYWGFENVLVNTFSESNNDNISQKLKRNRSIMKSKEFQAALKAYSGKIGIADRLTYFSRCYLFRLGYDKIVKIFRG